MPRDIRHRRRFDYRLRAPRSCCASCVPGVRDHRGGVHANALTPFQITNAFRPRQHTAASTSSRHDAPTRSQRPSARGVETGASLRSRAVQRRVARSRGFVPQLRHDHDRDSRAVAHVVRDALEVPTVVGCDSPAMNHEQRPITILKSKHRLPESLGQLPGVTGLTSHFTSMPGENQAPRRPRADGQDRDLTLGMARSTRAGRLRNH